MTEKSPVTCPFVAAPGIRTESNLSPVFIAVIFVSAFLLFQVQPVIARYILPWYGGSPAVWTTCLLFFQVGLLAGYAYAHALVTFLRESRKWQAGIHVALIVIGILLLPITPTADLRPDASGANPVIGIIRLLSLTVGFPYFLLSATGPLIQQWFSEVHPKRSPYRLYAVSNLGSLLGLVSYPFFFEPLFRVSQQTMLWSLGFAGYGLLAFATAFVFVKSEERPQSSGSSSAGAEAPCTPRLPDILLWIAFSACGSMLLLSLTSQMCQDVAVVPFLWVVPLSLYLLTFVIAFDHSRWYSRPIVVPLAVAVIGGTIFLMNHLTSSDDWPLVWQIAIYCSAVFFGCLICNGEVVRLKPNARHLTGFYLALSLGGALGGLFVSLVAPIVFNGYWEVHVTFVLLAILTSSRIRGALVARWRKSRMQKGAGATMRATLTILCAVLWIAAMVAMVIGLRSHMIGTRDQVIAASRGFYGVLQVTEDDVGTEQEQRSLYHGRINHGAQYTDPKYRRVATTYYHVNSGIGTVFRFLPKRGFTPPTPIHVGIVGLGVGTIATYAKQGDRFRFYEIDPHVEDFARSHFTYLKDCEGEESVVLGDGRISLERELQEGKNQKFDVLVIDAFSGDSIPIHLLTREAFDLYNSHLKPDGILAVHITNRYLDLSDPVRNIARQLDIPAYAVGFEPKNGYPSDWILMTRDPIFTNTLKTSGRAVDWRGKIPKQTLWTDDYSNLFEVMK